MATQKGIRWRYSYILDGLASNAVFTLMVTAPKYLPTPTDGVADPKNAMTPQRRIVESNGDVILLYSSRVDDKRTEHVIRVERHQSDWDLLLQIIADDSAKTTNPTFFDDASFRACSSKIAQILTKKTEQAAALNGP